MLPYSLVETIRAIRKGKLTSSLIHQICHQRIQDTTILNTYVTNDIPIPSAKPFPSSSFSASSSSSSPAPDSSLSLERIPLSIKANICMENTLTTAGSRMLSNYKSPITATVVERLLQHNGTINGSTNMDEFGMGSGTYYSHHSPTFNPFSLPWLIPNIVRLLSTATNKNNTPQGSSSSSPFSLPKLRKRKRDEWLVPGGSSGGAAVSVAIGTSQGAIGSDTGGSIRQPASFLGINGFKPTYGRIPRYGLIPYASSLDTVGILGRTVEDIIHLYALTNGYDPRDDTSIRNTNNPAVPSIVSLLSSATSNSTDTKTKPLAGIRIGIPEEYLPSELNSTTIEHWESTAKLLAEAGAEIRTVSLPSTPKALSAYYILAPAEAASNLARYDGVRYGYRAAEDVSSTSSSSFASSTHNASALLDLYARTRSEGFGSEVQRRILLGNFVLSSTARGQYYDIAVQARNEIRHDFARVFRSSSVLPFDDIHHSPVSRKNTASLPLASPEHGVDILLTPVSPSLPWHVPSEDNGNEYVGSNPTKSIVDRIKNPTDDYLNDIMTIPVSLAHLPAISVPVGSIPYPRTEYDQHIRSYLTEMLPNPRNDAIDPPHFIETVYESCRIPIGLQLIGRHSDEYTVLYVAKVLESLVNYRLPLSVTEGLNPYA